MKGGAGRKGQGLLLEQDCEPTEAESREQGSGRGMVIIGDGQLGALSLAYGCG